MEEENRGKILLELALHRYDEEVERNEAIDNKITTNTTNNTLSFF